MGHHLYNPASGGRPQNGSPNCMTVRDFLYQFGVRERGVVGKTAKKAAWALRLLPLPFLILTASLSTVAEPQAGDVALRLIVVKTQQQAVNLQRRLQAGEAFDDLAQKYSTDASA